MNRAERVYEDLIEPVAERMMHTCRRVTADDDEAFDAFQQALFQMWIRLDHVLAHRDPHACLLGMAAGATYDVLRRRERWRRRGRFIEELGAVSAVSPDGEDGGEADDDLRRLGDALASLPRPQAETVVLHAAAGATFDRIAAALDVDSETARAHWDEGRARAGDLSVVAAAADDEPPERMVEALSEMRHNMDKHPTLGSDDDDSLPRRSIRSAGSWSKRRAGTLDEFLDGSLDGDEPGLQVAETADGTDRADAEASDADAVEYVDWPEPRGETGEN